MNGTQNLTFEQGLVVGILAANEYQRGLPNWGVGRSPADTLNAVVDYSREVLAKFQGVVVPHFPDGIPAEALEEVDSAVLDLVEANLLP
jgi:hypothetical protein